MKQRICIGQKVQYKYKKELDVICKARVNFHCVCRYTDEN